MIGPEVRIVEGVGMAGAALVIVGVLLVVLGILAGGSIPFVTLGILALVAAGILQVLTSRRS